MRHFLQRTTLVLLTGLMPACSTDHAHVNRLVEGPTLPLPDDVDADHPVYQTSFDDPSDLADWRLEGGRVMSVAQGNLVLENDRKIVGTRTHSDHLVCWLTREVPADFLLEFTVRPEDRHRGLNIVFFNARGLHGENIFEPPIKPRDGLFIKYTRGDINNYHISYWASGRDTAHLRKNKGFHHVATGKDLVEPADPDTFQLIRIYKRGGLIRLTVDGRLALEYEDDGKGHGPVHDHSGWIGLRQMAYTIRCTYGYLRIFPLKPETNG